MSEKRTKPGETKVLSYWEEESRPGCNFKVLVLLGILASCLAGGYFVLASEYLSDSNAARTRAVNGAMIQYDQRIQVENSLRATDTAMYYATLTAPFNK